MQKPGAVKNRGPSSHSAAGQADLLGQLAACGRHRLLVGLERAGRDLEQHLPGGMPPLAHHRDPRAVPRQDRDGSRVLDDLARRPVPVGALDLVDADGDPAARPGVGASRAFVHPSVHP